MTIVFRRAENTWVIHGCAVPNDKPRIQSVSRGATAWHWKTAVFGAGCFWGVEARFNEMAGVLDTAVGYAGGEMDHPTYKEVCGGRTGHAEVVEVTFDSSRVRYEELLDTYFALHDPTQLNRQGPDYGTQYRSVIFTQTGEQVAEARAKITELNASGSFRRPIVTQVLPSATFWKAEEYHQRYLEKRGMVSCHI